MDNDSVPWHFAEGEAKPLSLPPGASWGQAYDCVCEDGNRYILGAYSADSHARICYWVNGVRRDIDVQDEDGGAYASALFVYQGDVYVVGSYKKSIDAYAARPCYWKNGLRFELSGSPAYEPTHLLVDERGVVVSLGSGIWRDGVYTELSAPPGAHAGPGFILRHDNDLYVAGSVVFSAASGDYTMPCYWKNGVRIDLPLPSEGGVMTGNVVRLAMVNNSLFAAGWYRGAQARGMYSEITVSLWRDQRLIERAGPHNYYYRRSTISVVDGSLVFIYPSEDWLKSLLYAGGKSYPFTYFNQVQAFCPLR